MSSPDVVIGMVICIVQSRIYIQYSSDYAPTYGRGSILWWGWDFALFRLTRLDYVYPSTIASIMNGMSSRVDYSLIFFKILKSKFSLVFLHPSNPQIIRALFLRKVFYELIHSTKNTAEQRSMQPRKT